MIALNPSLCLKLRDARRAAKVSQSELARELGCKQSAISMFEQGQPTKLNDAVVEKMAAKFGISLKEETPSETPVVCAAPQVVPSGTGYCPNPHCPSHQHYTIEGRTFLKPDRALEDPVGGRFCAICGEVLERACPNCGAPVHAGAICSLCGEPYLSVS